VLALFVDGSLAIAYNLKLFRVQSPASYLCIASYVALMTRSLCHIFLPRVFPFDWLWVFTTLKFSGTWLINFNGIALVINLVLSVVQLEKPQLSFNRKAFILSDKCRLPGMSIFFIVYA
jgi:hypothetical protein